LKTEEKLRESEAPAELAMQWLGRGLAVPGIKMRLEG
jgi:hypothetical protein